VKNPSYTFENEESVERVGDEEISVSFTFLVVCALVDCVVFQAHS